MKTTHLIGLCGSLIAAVFFIIIGIVLWNEGQPNCAIIALILAMVAVAGSIFQYNRSRFSA